MLRLLPGLTGEELSKVAGAVSLLRKGTPGAASVAVADTGNVDHYLLLELVSRTMSNLGADHSKPAVLERTKGFDAFCRKVPGVMQYVRAQCKTRVQQEGLLRIGIGLLRDNLEQMGWPTSSATIMAHIHRLPSVLNREFPGYASAKMLHLVVRQDADMGDHSDVREKRSRRN